METLASHQLVTACITPVLCLCVHFQVLPLHEWHAYLCLLSFNCRAQELLASRTATQMNAAIATQKSLTTLHGGVHNGTHSASRIRGGGARQAEGREAASHEDHSQKVGGMGDVEDPFLNNYELTGVGRGRLAQLSTEQLCATLKARSIQHKTKEHANKLIAKIENWKRDRSSSRRGTREDNVDGADESNGASDDDKNPLPPLAGGSKGKRKADTEGKEDKDGRKQNKRAQGGSEAGGAPRVDTSGILSGQESWSGSWQYNQ